MKAKNGLKLINIHFGNLFKDWEVCGGFARDVNFGLAPNDVDVIIIPNRSIAAHDHIFVVMSQISEMFAMFEVKTEVLVAYEYEGGTSVAEGSFADNLWGDIRIFFEDYKMDVLFSRHQSVQDVINTFDCNINQYILSEDWTQAYSAFRPENDPAEVGLRFFNDSLEAIPPARREKMQARFDLIQPKL